MNASNPVGTDELKAEVLQSVADDTRFAVHSTAATARVSLNIAPEAIPFESADKAALVHELATQFGTRYQPPPGLPSEMRREAPVDSLMSASIANHDIVLFKGGRLQLPGSDRVTPIHDLGFGTQTIAATVAGVSSEALYLCKQLCLLMWQATGITRKWDEFEDLVERRAYMTTTIVALGAPLISLLSEPLRAFLADDVAGTEGFAQHLGGLAEKSEGGIQAVPYCHEIELKIAVVDPVSGESEDCALDLMLHTRSDANRSRVKITTELESAHHNRLVERLVRKLAP